MGSEHPRAHHPGSITVNITFDLSIDPLILGAFQSKLQTSIHSSPDHFSMHVFKDSSSCVYFLGYYIYSEMHKSCGYHGEF